MATMLETAENNGKQHRAAPTVGPHVELRQNRAKANYCQHMLPVQPATMSRLMIPLRNFHHHSHPLPDKVANMNKEKKCMKIRNF